MSCYLKRLERVVLINAHSNLEILNAFQQLLAGGELNIEPGDFDFSSLEELVAWVHPNLNDLNRESYDRSCPESIWREPDRVIDLAAGDWLARLIELAQDMRTGELERPRGIDHVYAPSVRGGNAFQMLNLALQAWRYTGEEQYKRFFQEELLGQQYAEEVAHTAALLTMPHWCQSFYGGHISYPVAWVLIEQLPEGDPLRESLRAAVHEEYWEKSRGPTQDLKFDLIYAMIGPDEGARAEAQTRALANLEAFGGNGGILDDPRRGYSQSAEEILASLAGGPEALRCPSQEERALCEDGFELMGLRIPGESITGACTGGALDCPQPVEEGAELLCAQALASEPLPVLLRQHSDFIWQRNPYALGRHYGADGSSQSAGLDLIEEFWLARHAGIIEVGRGQVLAWETSGSCPEE